jgi:hypothetical protein
VALNLFPLVFFVCRLRHVFFIAFLSICWSTCHALITSNEFSCGGMLESKVWQLWDSKAKKIMQRDILGYQFFELGNSYALYDFQNYLHSLLSMMRRCHRAERIGELAGLLLPVYNKVEAIPGQLGGRGWVCRGGEICNSRNKLIGTEVQLASVQGLALFADLANAIVASGAKSQSANRFLELTTSVSLSHLQRWGNDHAVARVNLLSNSTMSDVKDHTSDLLLTDKHLWQILIYAEMAGVLDSRPDLRRRFIRNDPDYQQLRRYLRALLKLMSSRVVVDAVAGDRLPDQRVSIDGGFWRLYPDNRYSAYLGTKPPSRCLKSESGKVFLSYDVPQGKADVGVGWDFSHSRRFVYVVDSIERNRVSLSRVFTLEAADLPSVDLGKGLAAQLINNIWNGDKQSPLFTNYWSGANGWYRVGYGGVVGQCREGIPPYGLSSAFVTGGYPVWRVHYSIIGELAKTIYHDAEFSNADSTGYILRYYPGLSSIATEGVRTKNQLMFWPSLVY